VKCEIQTVRLTDDSGNVYTVSDCDSDGDRLKDGLYRIWDDTDENEIFLDQPTLKALLRAVEAAATGVLLD
jgi:hypothetical protein